MFNVLVQPYLETKTCQAEQTNDLLQPAHIKNYPAFKFRASIVVVYVPVFQNENMFVTENIVLTFITRLCSKTYK